MMPATSFGTEVDATEDLATSLCNLLTFIFFAGINDCSLSFSKLSSSSHVPSSVSAANVCFAKR